MPFSEKMNKINKAAGFLITVSIILTALILRPLTVSAFCTDAGASQSAGVTLSADEFTGTPVRVEVIYTGETFPKIYINARSDGSMWNEETAPEQAGTLSVLKKDQAALNERYKMSVLYINTSFPQDVDINVLFLTKESTVILLKTDTPEGYDSIAETLLPPKEVLGVASEGVTDTSSAATVLSDVGVQGVPFRDDVTAQTEAGNENTQADEKNSADNDGYSGEDSSAPSEGTPPEDRSDQGPSSSGSQNDENIDSQDEQKENNSEDNEKESSGGLIKKIQAFIQKYGQKRLITIIIVLIVITIATIVVILFLLNKDKVVLDKKKKKLHKGIPEIKENKPAVKKCPNETEQDLIIPEFFNEEAYDIGYVKEKPVQKKAADDTKSDIAPAEEQTEPGGEIDQNTDKINGMDDKDAIRMAHKDKAEDDVLRNAPARPDIPNKEPVSSPQPAVNKPDTADTPAWIKKNVQPAWAKKNADENENNIFF